MTTRRARIVALSLLLASGCAPADDPRRSSRVVAPEAKPAATSGPGAKAPAQKIPMH